MTETAGSQGDVTGGNTGCVWIVATPIGTITDLSPRAAETLARADLVLAEDTRQLKQLARAAGLVLSGRVLSLHEHNERQRLAEVLEALEEGHQVALTSDAGTPILSDPGFLLVREARKLGHRILSVPGPSAFTAALAASGQPPLPATLAGFLPPRRGARRKRLEALSALPGTIVFFLSPHRLGAELREGSEILGADRPATLLAELSKRHERAVTGTIGQLAACPEVQQPRGEYVLVVGPAEKASGRKAEPRHVDAALARLVYGEAVRRGMGRAEALRWTAQRLGLGRTQVFELLAEDDPGR